MPRIVPSTVVFAFALAGCAAAHRPARAPEPAPGGIVVDKVVAFVVTRPITLSDCEVEVRLSRALEGNVAGALGDVSPADEAAVLPRLVDRAAVIRAFQRNYGDDVDAGAVKAAAAKLRARFTDPSSWARFLDRVQLSEDEIAEQLRRMLQAQAILVARVREFVKVDRKEVDEYLARHPGVTRDQAETAVTIDAEALQTPGILADARRIARARVVDPIVAPPEGAGTAVGTSNGEEPH